MRGHESAIISCYLSPEDGVETLREWECFMEMFLWPYSSYISKKCMVGTETASVPSNTSCPFGSQNENRTKFCQKTEKELIFVSNLHFMNWKKLCIIISLVTLIGCYFNLLRDEQNFKILSFCTLQTSFSWISNKFPFFHYICNYFSREGFPKHLQCFKFVKIVKVF